MGLPELGSTLVEFSKYVYGYYSSIASPVKAMENCTIWKQDSSNGWKIDLEITQKYGCYYQTVHEYNAHTHTKEFYGYQKNMTIAGKA